MLVSISISYSYPMNKFIKLCLPLLAVSCITAQAQTPLTPANPGFENGAEEGWSMWVPSDSKEVNCHRALSKENPHSGAACLKLTADQFSRFSVSPKQTFSVQSGERYRISFWIRGMAEIAANNPGFIARITLSPTSPGIGGNGTDLYNLSLDGKLKVNGVPSYTSGIPSLWTRVSSVIGIPDGVNKMSLGLFMVQAKGDVFLDDVSVEKVDSNTPLSEIDK